MNEHVWKAGGYTYRAGKPNNLGDLSTSNQAIVQRQGGMSGTWETVATDPAIAEEILRLASAAAGRR